MLGWDEMRGLSGIAEHLGIQAPDHTAAGDVRCLRDCWHALRVLRVGMGWEIAGEVAP